MDDYETGYKKPPKEHQFTKGQSGNPKGRPRKPKPRLSIDDAEIMRRLDAELITVGSESVPRCVAEARQIFVQAVRGNKKARKLLERLAKRIPRHSGGGVLEVPWDEFMRRQR